MGLRINSASASIDALAASRATRVPAVTEPRDTPLRRSQGLTEPLTLQVGFGKNSINVGGASLDTLGSNFRRVRESVPSVEELREQARERFREENARAEAQRASTGDPVKFDVTQDTPPPASEVTLQPVEQPVRPEPAPQAREFEPPAVQPETAQARLDVSV